MKNVKERIAFIVFALIGVGLIIGGVVYAKYHMEFRHRAVSITGEIVDIETYRDSKNEIHHRVYVTYEYDGIRYEEIPLGSYNSSMRIGQEISLLCDPQNPGNIEQTSTGYWLIGTLLFMGVIFSLVGFLNLVPGITGSRKKKRLQQTGQTLYAVVDEVVCDRSLTVNGRHPYYVYCTYKDEYKDIQYRFKSERLWSNPEDIFPQGSDIKVYVDPSDYSKYYVDTDTQMSAKVRDFT